MEIVGQRHLGDGGVDGHLKLGLVDLLDRLFDGAVLLLARIDQERVVDAVGSDANAVENTGSAGSSSSSALARGGIVEQAAAALRARARAVARLIAGRGICCHCAAGAAGAASARSEPS